MGDDGAGARHDGRRDYVFVIWIGKAVCAFQWLPILNLGIVEVASHLFDQTSGSAMSRARFLSSRDQLSCLMIFQLIENRRTPYWTIHALDGERKQEITL